MIIVAAVALVAASVPLFGGRLSGLLALRLRAPWLLTVALVVQALIIPVLPHAVAGSVGRLLHVASYFVLAAFLYLNRKVPGLVILVVGGLVNFVAIVANGGVMPASRAALEAAGQPVPSADRFANSGKVDDTELLFLGDVLAWPDPLPLHNVFSIGDVVLVGGAAVMLHEFSGSRLSSRRGGHRSHRRSARNRRTAAAIASE